MRILITALLLVSTTIAYPFGIEGNRAIAKAAEQRLSESTQAQIKKILGSESMADASSWPDSLADSKEPDAVVFRGKHPGFARWHFTYIPLDSPYTRNNQFATADDIVHMIDICVSVLEGRSAEMRQADALRWLIDLVGDLHQPLNVGTYYYSFGAHRELGVISNPDEAKGKDHSDAGDRLWLGKRHFNAYWDDFMVSYILTTTGGAPLEKTIQQRIPKLKTSNRGDYHDWVVDWASDSIVAARKVYRGVGFGEYRRINENTKGTVKWHVNLELLRQPLPYEDAHLELAKDQMAKAAFRLSELLQVIKWGEPPAPVMAVKKADPGLQGDRFDKDRIRRALILSGELNVKK